MIPPFNHIRLHIRRRPPATLLIAAALFLALLAPDPIALGQSSAPRGSMRERREEHRKRLKELVEQERKRLEEAAAKRKMEETRNEAARRGIQLDEKGNLISVRKKPDEQTVAQMTQIDSGPPLVLVMKPFSQVAQVGERFVTEVALYSDLSRDYRGVSVRIDFEPDVVQPVQIFDFPVGDLLDPANPPTSRIDSRSLTWSADFATTTSSVNERPLLYIGWVAVGPAVSSTLAFHDGDSEERCAVWAGGKNLLSSGQTVSNACINGEMIVHAPSSMRDPGLRIVQDGDVAAMQPASASRVALALVGPPDPPAPGEEFVASVEMLNPDQTELNEVHLAIGFDPKKVEILDWDYRNWIRRGVNVFDGHAHGRYPWNVHLQNEVNNRRGRIAYQMGLTRSAALPSGSLVRIHARALTPDAFASMTLYPADATPLWSTDVLLGQMSLLERADGASGVSLRLTDVSGIMREAATDPLRP